jgi:ceramide glucosyltransferase
MILLEVITKVLLFLIVCAAVYQGFAVFCVWDFLRGKRNPDRLQHAVPISIIKPLKGWDAGLEANLESFCTQDYPAFEILLGFTDPEDEAIPRLHDSAAAHGRCREIISTNKYGANNKVSNLQGLVEAAAHPLLAISDSDMRVDRFYLRDIVNEYYHEKKPGLVTCLYKVSAPETTGAALESLTTALDFIPSVLVARRLEGVTFGLGATLLLSRKALEDSGGLAAIANYLADDYQIGNRLWKKGHTVTLSRVVIENIVGPMSIADYFRHQVRWARTYRASRPHGYVGYGITYLFPFTLMFACLEGPTAFALSLLGLSCCLRLALAVLLYAKEIHSKKWLKWLVLLPIKDLAGFGIWVWSFMSNKIVWKTMTCVVRKDGTIMTVE